MCAKALEIARSGARRDALTRACTRGGTLHARRHAASEAPQGLLARSTGTYWNGVTEGNVERWRRGAAARAPSPASLLSTLSSPRGYPGKEIRAQDGASW
eukprot:9014197-Pyramimonas_sp.AAC.1